MPLLSPRSIAVVGASHEPGKVGHEIFKNLVEEGFAGDVYPVNPKGGEILGKKVYASVKDIPDTVDLAVIVTPAPTVAGILRECASKEIPSVVVISAGFGEVHTDEGKRMEEELRAIALENGIQLVGPNCLGVLRPSAKMNASFAKELPPAGSIALISQSGATAVALMDAAPAYGLGFSAVLSIGNKTVLDECDFLALCADDPETRVIGFYLESIKDGRRFLELARDVARSKPIVLLKAGVSAHGRKAAASHTGALAGSDAAVEALCAQTGIRRARSTEEFLDLLAALSAEPPLLSRRIAIITNAGGPGILATDAAEAHGLLLPQLQEKRVSELKKTLPAAASTSNPIDVLGDAGADRYGAALRACAEDPDIDGVAVLLTPQVMTPCEQIAETIAASFKTAPLMPVTTSFVGGESVAAARAALRRHGIPTFDTPERAIRALAALRTPVVTPAPAHPLVASTRATDARRLLARRKGLISERLAEELFSLYGLPLPAQDIARNADEAVQTAGRIGYPVVAKVSSPDILHKTDIGGIRVNLKTEDEVRRAVTEIDGNVRAHMPEATFRGVLIQKFLPVGSEFIVGALRDPSFGPLVMVGLGGIYTELFADTSFRLAPVTEEEAYVMLSELKAWKLLTGLRGKPPADIASLATLIALISQLVTDCPMIKELDLNPVLVGESQTVIADVKIVVESA